MESSTASPPPCNICRWAIDGRFGSLGSWDTGKWGSSVPAYTTLVFEIELMEIVE